MFIGWRKVLSNFVQITSSILYTMRCVFIFVDLFIIPTLQFYVSSTNFLCSLVHGDAFTLQQSMRKMAEKEKYMWRVNTYDTDSWQKRQNQCCQSRTVPAGTYRISNKTVHIPWCSLPAKISAYTGRCTGLVPESQPVHKHQCIFFYFDKNA